MDVTARQHHPATIVSVSGSIDSLTVERLTEFLAEQIGSGRTNLVLDLAQVNLMSSAGLRAILAAFKEVRQPGGDLRIAAAQPGVLKVLKMAGFTNILKSFDTTDEAVASFS